VGFRGACSEGEAGDGGAVLVHRAEGVAVGEGDVLDEFADDAAALTPAFGGGGDAGGGRGAVLEGVGKGAVTAELPAGDVEGSEGHQAINRPVAGTGDLVEDREEDDDLAASGDVAGPSIQGVGAVAGGVVPGVASALAEGEVDGAAADAGVLDEPAEAAFHSCPGRAIVAVGVSVLAVFLEALECAIDVVLDLADREGQGERGAAGLRAAPRCRGPGAHLLGGDADRVGEEERDRVVFPAGFLGTGGDADRAGGLVQLDAVDLAHAVQGVLIGEAPGEGGRRRTLCVRGVPGAFLCQGDGGGIRAALQLRAFRVDDPDVDGDGREAEERHQEDGDDDADGTAFVGVTVQPPHSMTPLPVMGNGPAMPVMVESS